MPYRIHGRQLIDLTINNKLLMLHTAHVSACGRCHSLNRGLERCRTAIIQRQRDFPTIPRL